MIKFTFGPKLREGLGLLLTDEGLERLLSPQLSITTGTLKRKVRNQEASIAPSLVTSGTSRATPPTMTLGSSMK